jgi:RNA polymerase sigma-70 factor (ECF subfamily)
VTEVSDFELLDRWRAGDRRAGNELFGRYYDPIRAYFISKSPPRERQDLVQETFQRLTRSCDKFDKRSSFRTYLYRIAKHTLVDFFRRQARGKFDFDPLTHSVVDVMGVSPSHALTKVERHQRLLDCLRALPVETRDLLELYYWHDLTATELGELIGVDKEQTVRSRLRKARLDLQACLQSDEAPEAEDASLESQLREIGEFMRTGQV